MTKFKALGNSCDNAVSVIGNSSAEVYKKFVDKYKRIPAYILMSSEFNKPLSLLIIQASADRITRSTWAYYGKKY